MAIETPMIHAGPTIKRDQVPINCVQITDSVPEVGAAARYYDARTGIWDIMATPAGTHSGEMLAVIDLITYRASLYVWIDSTQTWTLARLVSEYIDPGTGVEWDPLARFYTPLAS